MKKMNKKTYNFNFSVYEKPRKVCIKGLILCRVKQAIDRVIGILFG